MLLTDKVCVVAGAASLRGIGYATAELFAEHGARILAVDAAMDGKAEAEIRAAIGQRVPGAAPVHGLKCDISDPADCEQAVERALALHGRVDCLVNTAGIVQSKSMLDIESRELARMLDVNLAGAFHLCQSVLRSFARQRSGVIVNVASVAAQRGGGLVGGAHYAASKGGLVSLTKTIAREFGPLGIRANVVCPSMTETGMLDGLTPERFEEIVAGIPLKRAGKARDVAGACLYLASDLAAYVTGATLDVNGGSHIH
jgi:NAD(P)-dependent dehydrogenase (short-subunit alcohol dehydrogenase family)